MKKLLIINGSITNDKQSMSLKVLNKLIEEYKKNNPNDEIEIIDANKTHNEFYVNANNIDSYYKNIKSDEWIEKVKNADKIIITSPMINFGPAPVIKNFMDSIMVPNKTFTYKVETNNGKNGLLRNLKVLVLTSQGSAKGTYEWGNLNSWLTGIWKFLGAEDVRLLNIHSTDLENNRDKDFDEVFNEIYKDDFDKVLNNF
ncbi:FMN-dependent NADH-azoreductase [Mycoplasmopsis gallinarum]|uniref:FMN-dependent NADH-azoreductase n=1 Tax=Mycoplasmopsis gallinarum TaxID=29557 RepID=UPI000487FFB0|nr:FMN-dependent NADH-azoreductase [Mycoplasmopsis gallinarum]